MDDDNLYTIPEVRAGDGGWIGDAVLSVFMVLGGVGCVIVNTILLKTALILECHSERDVEHQVKVETIVVLYCACFAPAHYFLNPLPRLGNTSPPRALIPSHRVSSGSRRSTSLAELWLASLFKKPVMERNFRSTTRLKTESTWSSNIVPCLGTTATPIST